MEPDSTDSVNTNPPSVNNIPAKVGYRIPWIPIVILLVGFIAFGTGVYFSGPTSRLVPFLGKLSLNKSSSTYLPLVSDNSAIHSIDIVYQIQAKVEFVEGTNEKATLKTDISGIPNLPEFIITPDTQVVSTLNKRDFPLNWNRLKTNSTVNIDLKYDIKNKKWKLARVSVPVDPTSFVFSNTPATRSATPSASVRP